MAVLETYCRVQVECIPKFTSVCVPASRWGLVCDFSSAKGMAKMLFRCHWYTLCWGRETNLFPLLSWTWTYIMEALMEKGKSKYHKWKPSLCPGHSLPLPYLCPVVSPAVFCFELPVGASFSCILANSFPEVACVQIIPRNLQACEILSACDLSWT